MGFLSRFQTSNDIPKGQNPWGSDGVIADDFFLLISGQAQRCKGCGRVTKKCYLEEVICPDCFKQAKGIESPAIGRVRAASSYYYSGGWGASNEPGEAD